ncbi:MAG: hypothetical protein ACRD9L_10900, partial [Bryobacteraceae bacterium]
CNRILEEEAAHLRFQAFTFWQLHSRRPPLAKMIVARIHKLFALSTAVLVWFDHRAVFLAGGRSFRRLCRETLDQFESLERPAGSRRIIGVIRHDTP